MAQFILVAVVAWYVFGVVTVVLSIGKPRKPVTPQLAAGVVVASAIIVSGLGYVYTQL